MGSTVIGVKSDGNWHENGWDVEKWKVKREGNENDVSIP